MGQQIRGSGSDIVALDVCEQMKCAPVAVVTSRAPKPKIAIFIENGYLQVSPGEVECSKAGKTLVAFKALERVGAKR